MSYMNAQSELPVDVFGASAETQPVQQQQLEAGREEQDHSKRQYFQPKSENNSDFLRKIGSSYITISYINIMAQRNSSLKYICMIVEADNVWLKCRPPPPKKKNQTKTFDAGSHPVCLANDILNNVLELNNV